MITDIIKCVVFTLIFDFLLWEFYCWIISRSRAEILSKNSKQQLDYINRLLCKFLKLHLGDNYSEVVLKMIDDCGGKSMSPPCFWIGDHEYDVLHIADFENGNWYVNEYWRPFAKCKGEIKEIVENKERETNGE